MTDSTAKTCLVVYHTFTGHTRALGEKVARRMEELGWTVELVRDKEFPRRADIPEFEAIALGSPCQGGRVARTMKKRITRVLEQDLSGKLAITFATSAGKQGHELVCQELDEWLTAAGATCLARVGCRGRPKPPVDHAVDEALLQDLF